MAHDTLNDPGVRGLWIDRDEGIFGLELRGNVYRERCPAMSATLEAAMLEGMRALVADAREVALFDSAALRVLLDAAVRLGPAGGRLVFVGLRARPMRMLQLTGLFGLVGVCSPDPDRVREEALLPPPPDLAKQAHRVAARLALLDRAVADEPGDGGADLARQVELTVVTHCAQRIAETGVVPDREELRRRADRAVRSVAKQVFSANRLQLDAAAIERMIDATVDEVAGHGPIEGLLRDESISEIMVTGPDTVLVEGEGGMRRVPVRFLDDDHLLHTIRRIATGLGRRIDLKSPTLDARLPDGSRVHAVIPPITPDGPVLTIRKFRRPIRQLEDLLQTRMMSAEMALFLATCVKARLNIVLCGPASSGKTTLLNVLASLVPADERLVTIEDNVEMRLDRPRGTVVRMETRGANIEGEGQVDLRSLVRESLRMRPDRILVGEARGGEVLEILQVMRSGHDGSMTTVHATSPVDLVTRMTTLGMTAGLPIPEPALRRMVVDAVDVIVQLNRFPNGERLIVAIAEPRLVGDGDGDLRVDDLFRFEQEGYDEQGRVVGKHRAVRAPSFLARFRQQGLPFPEEVFVSKG